MQDSRYSKGMELFPHTKGTVDGKIVSWKVQARSNQGVYVSWVKDLKGSVKVRKGDWRRSE
jgi:hypothetical protein